MTNKELLAFLLERIERLERLLVQFYDRSICADEMNFLRTKMQDEDRESCPRATETIRAVVNTMINESEGK